MVQPPRPPASIRRRPLRGVALKVGGSVALAAGTLSGALAFQSARSSPYARLGPVGTAIAFALMAALLGFGRWAVRRGAQHGMPPAEPLTSLPEDEPIVLFLRSFETDRDFSHIQSGPQNGPWAAALTTEEQQLGNATAPFGRMMALGSPDDRLPPAGAAKDYAGDGEWRARVLAGLARARLVLLTASPGPAVRWETERVIERNLADRLVVLIVGDGRQYEAFRANLSDRFPSGLPEYQHQRHGFRIADDAYVRAAVWFEADWTPHLVRLDDPHDDRSKLVHPSRWVETAFPLAIWPVYRRAGLSPPRLPSEPRGRPRAVPVAIALLTPLLLILVALSARSAAHSHAGDAAMAGGAALLLVLFAYLVWRGGYFSIWMATFWLLLFGGVMTGAGVILLLVLGGHRWWVTGPSVSLLAAGLLLRRRSVRDWAASRVLFPPTTANDQTPPITGN